MKKLLLLLVLGLGLWQGWGWWQRSQVPPLQETPYLVVYGRDRCGYTQQTLQALTQAGIPHQYRQVDNAAVADVLHQRMRSHGLKTSRYLLPVVDLNNEFSIRPDNAELVAEARRLPLRQ